MVLNNASKRVKFGPVDGTALAPFLFLLANPSWTMFYILIGFSIALVVLDYFKIKLPAIFRILRTFIIGESRLIRPYTRNKV